MGLARFILAVECCSSYLINNSCVIENRCCSFACRPNEAQSEYTTGMSRKIVKLDTVSFEGESFTRGFVVKYFPQSIISCSAEELHSWYVASFSNIPFLEILFVWIFRKSDFFVLNLTKITCIIIMKTNKCIMWSSR